MLMLDLNRFEIYRRVIQRGSSAIDARCCSAFSLM
jgi:hypothetical protein